MTQQSEIPIGLNYLFHPGVDIRQIEENNDEQNLSELEEETEEVEEESNEEVPPAPETHLNVDEFDELDVEFEMMEYEDRVMNTPPPKGFKTYAEYAYIPCSCTSSWSFGKNHDPHCRRHWEQPYTRLASEIKK